MIGTAIRQSVAIGLHPRLAIVEPMLSGEASLLRGR
jgi:hypothetical protein